MTAELVLQELERRRYTYYDDKTGLRCANGDWRTLVLPVPFSHHFMAIATVEREPEGLKGRVNVLSLDGLKWREEDLISAERQDPVAQIGFLIPYGFSWDAEGLLAASDGSVNMDFAEHLARDLIMSTNAGSVEY